MDRQNLQHFDHTLNVSLLLKKGDREVQVKGKKNSNYGHGVALASALNNSHLIKTNVMMATETWLKYRECTGSVILVSI